jgi:hypothetical protein
LERERRRGRRDLNLASGRDGPFFFPSATPRGRTSPRPVRTEGESPERERFPLPAGLSPLEQKVLSRK